MAFKFTRDIKPLKVCACEDICSSFSCNLRFKKASKDYFYEDYVLLRNKLLQLEHDENDPTLPSRIYEIANMLQRYIETAPKSVQHTVEFAREIHRKLLFLHELNCRNDKVGQQCPISQELQNLLIRYIELEYEVLYLGPQRCSVENQTLVENRILSLLLLMLHSPTKEAGKESSVKNTVDACTMNALYIINSIKMEYKKEHPLVENMMGKLLKKLNILDKLSAMREKHKLLTLDKLLEEPQVQRVHEHLQKRDTMFIEDSSSSDEEDLVEVAEVAPPIKTEVKLEPPEERKVNVSSYHTRYDFQKKIMTIDLDDEDEDCYMIYFQPEAQRQDKKENFFLDDSDSDFKEIRISTNSNNSDRYNNFSWLNELSTSSNCDRNSSNTAVSSDDENSNSTDSVCIIDNDSDSAIEIFDETPSPEEQVSNDNTPSCSSEGNSSKQQDIVARTHQQILSQLEEILLQCDDISDNDIEDEEEILNKYHDDDDDSDDDMGETTSDRSLSSLSCDHESRRSDCVPLKSADEDTTSSCDKSDVKNEEQVTKNESEKKNALKEIVALTAENSSTTDNKDKSCLQSEDDPTHIVEQNESSDPKNLIIENNGNSKKVDVLRENQDIEQTSNVQTLNSNVSDNDADSVNESEMKRTHPAKSDLPETVVTSANNKMDSIESEESVISEENVTSRECSDAAKSNVPEENVIISERLSGDNTHEESDVEQENMPSKGCTEDDVNTIVHEKCVEEEENALVTDEYAHVNNEEYVIEEVIPHEECVTEEQSISGYEECILKETTIKPPTCDTEKETTMKEKYSTEANKTHDECIVEEPKVPQEKCAVIDENTLHEVHIVAEETISHEESVGVEKDILYEECIVAEENILHEECIITEENMSHEECVVTEENMSHEECIVTEESVSQEDYIVEEENLSHIESIVAEENLLLREKSVAEKDSLSHEECITEETVTTSNETNTKENSNDLTCKNSVIEAPNVHNNNNNETTDSTFSDNDVMEGKHNEVDINAKEINVSSPDHLEEKDNSSEILTQISEMHDNPLTRDDKLKKGSAFDALPVSHEIEVPCTTTSQIEENEQTTNFAETENKTTENKTDEFPKEYTDTFDNHNCSNNLDVLAFVASEQQKMENEELKQKGKKVKKMRKRSLQRKNKESEVIEPRVTRSTTNRNKANNNRKPVITVGKIQDNLQCLPSTFMNLGSLVTPPPICVYNMIPGNATDTEESLDEPLIFLQTQEVTIKHSTVFDEDTIEDGITLISSTREEMSNKEVVISIPESINDYPGINYEILEQTEEFASSSNFTEIKENSDNSIILEQDPVNNMNKSGDVDKKQTNNSVANSADVDNALSCEIEASKENRKPQSIPVKKRRNYCETNFISEGNVDSETNQKKCTGTKNDGELELKALEEDNKSNSSMQSVVPPNDLEIKENASTEHCEKLPTETQQIVNETIQLTKSNNTIQSKLTFLEESTSGQEYKKSLADTEISQAPPTLDEPSSNINFNDKNDKLVDHQENTQEMPTLEKEVPEEKEEAFPLVIAYEVEAFTEEVIEEVTNKKSTSCKQPIKSEKHKIHNASDGNCRIPTKAALKSFQNPYVHLEKIPDDIQAKTLPAKIKTFKERSKSQDISVKYKKRNTRSLSESKPKKEKFENSELKKESTGKKYKPPKETESKQRKNSINSDNILPDKSVKNEENKIKTRTSSQKPNQESIIEPKRTKSKKYQPIEELPLFAIEDNVRITYIDKTKKVKQEKETVKNKPEDKFKTEQKASLKGTKDLKDGQKTKTVQDDTKNLKSKSISEKIAISLKNSENKVDMKNEKKKMNEKESKAEINEKINKNVEQSDKKHNKNNKRAGHSDSVAFKNKDVEQDSKKSKIEKSKENISKTVTFEDIKEIQQDETIINNNCENSVNKIGEDKKNLTSKRKTFDDIEGVQNITKKLKTKPESKVQSENIQVTVPKNEQIAATDMTKNAKHNITEQHSEETSTSNINEADLEKTSTVDEKDIISESGDKINEDIIEKEDITQIENENKKDLDQKTNSKFEENPNSKLEENLNSKLEENLNSKLEENLNSQLEENLNSKLEENLNSQLEENLNSKLEENLISKNEHELQAEDVPSMHTNETIIENSSETFHEIVEIVTETTEGPTNNAEVANENENSSNSKDIDENEEQCSNSQECILESLIEDKSEDVNKDDLPVVNVLSEDNTSKSVPIIIETNLEKDANNQKSISTEQQTTVEAINTNTETVIINDEIKQNQEYSIETTSETIDYLNISKNKTVLEEHGIHTINDGETRCIFDGKNLLVITEIDDEDPEYVTNIESSVDQALIKPVDTTEHASKEKEELELHVETAPNLKEDTALHEDSNLKIKKPSEELEGVSNLMNVNVVEEPIQETLFDEEKRDSIDLETVADTNSDKDLNETGSLRKVTLEENVLESKQLDDNEIVTEHEAVENLNNSEQNSNCPNDLFTENLNNYDTESINSVIEKKQEVSKESVSVANNKVADNIENTNKKTEEILEKMDEKDVDRNKREISICNIEKTSEEDSITTTPEPSNEALDDNSPPTKFIDTNSSSEKVNAKQEAKTKPPKYGSNKKRIPKRIDYIIENLKNRSTLKKEKEKIVTPTTDDDSLKLLSDNNTQVSMNKNDTETTTTEDKITTPLENTQEEITTISEDSPPCLQRQDETPINNSIHDTGENEMAPPELVLEETAPHYLKSNEVTNFESTIETTKFPLEIGTCEMEVESTIHVHEEIVTEGTVLNEVHQDNSIAPQEQIVFEVNNTPKQNENSNEGQACQIESDVVTDDNFNQETVSISTSQLSEGTIASVLDETDLSQNSESPVGNTTSLECVPSTEILEETVVHNNDVLEETPASRDSNCCLNNDNIEECKPKIINDDCIITPFVKKIEEIPINSDNNDCLNKDNVEEGKPKIFKDDYIITPFVKKENLTVQVATSLTLDAPMQQPNEINLNTTTTKASSGCEISDDNPLAEILNVYDDGKQQQQHPSPNKNYFIFLRGTDHNYHSLTTVSDPLLGGAGEEDINESDQSSDIVKKIVPQELVDDDNILSYALSENNLNQEPSSSLNESSVDSSIDFQLQLEQCLIGNSLVGQESSPPLTQIINCDNLYQTTLKQEVLEYDDSSGFSKDSNEVYINQMSLENMNEFMDVLTNIQKLNNMAKSTPRRDTVNINEFQSVPDFNTQPVQVNQNLELNYNFIQMPEYPIAPDAPNIEHSVVNDVSETVSFDFANFYYLPVTTDNASLTTNAYNSKKVIVEPIPQSLENSKPFMDVNISNIKNMPVTGNSCTMNMENSPSIEKCNIDVQPLKHIEAETVTKVDNISSLGTSINNNSSGNNSVKTLVTPISESNQNKESQNSLGFVRTSSRTRVSAPRPKKLNDRRNFEESGSSSSDEHISKIDDTKIKTPAENGIKIKIRDDLGINMSLLSKENSLYIIEESNGLHNNVKIQHTVQEKPELKQSETQPELKQLETQPELKQLETQPELKQSEIQLELKQPETQPELKQSETQPELKQSETLKKPKPAEENLQPVKSEVSKKPKPTTENLQPMKSPKVTQKQDANISVTKDKNKVESPLPLPTVVSPAPTLLSTSVPATVETVELTSTKNNVEDVPIQSDMIDNVKRRKRKPVDYSSIEKLLENDEYEYFNFKSLQHKSKHKKHDSEDPTYKSGTKRKLESCEKPKSSKTPKSSALDDLERSKLSFSDPNTKNSIFEDSDDDIPKKKKSKQEVRTEPDMNALFDELVREGNVNNVGLKSKKSTSDKGSKNSTTTSTTTTKPIISITTTTKSTSSRTVTTKPTNSSSVTTKPTNSSSVTTKPTNSSTITTKPTNSNTVTTKPTNSSTTTTKSTPSTVTIKPTTSNTITAKPCTSSTSATMPTTSNTITANSTTSSMHSITTAGSLFNLEQKKSDSTIPVGVVCPMRRPTNHLRKEPPPPPPSINSRSSYGGTEESRSNQYYQYYSDRSRRSYPHSNTECRESSRSSHQSSSRRIEYPSHSSDPRYLSSQRTSSNSSRSGRSSRHYSNSRSNMEPRNYRFSSGRDLEWLENMKKKLPHVFKDEVFF